jgi:hypothetical protein
MLFIKKFYDVASGKAAPNEAEVEVYTSGSLPYTELENQGTYTTIVSKDSIPRTNLWLSELASLLFDKTHCPSTDFAFPNTNRNATPKIETNGFMRI